MCVPGNQGGGLMTPLQAEATPGLLTQGDCNVTSEALIIESACRIRVSGKHLDQDGLVPALPSSNSVNNFETTRDKLQTSFTRLG